ncbi:hypothetical protein IJL65_04690 [bacterium]|nr:hypothetical protein [bacterium]
MIWKQNSIVNSFLEKQDSKYAKFSAIDQLLEEEFYDEEILKDSANDMVE